MPTPSRKQTSHPIRLYLIDVHPLIRVGLRSFFDTQPSVSVVGDASTLATALPALRLSKPDVVITDTFPIPKTVLRRQHALHILYTFETLEHCSAARLTQGLAQGCAGFVLKSLPLDGFLRVVHQVASGRKYRDPAFMRLLAAQRQQQARVLRISRKRGADTRKVRH